MEKIKNIHKEWQIQTDGSITLKNILLVFQGSELKFKGEIDVNN